ncbi:MAG: pyridoxamine 5'-phosphate oxidase family protein, partial [Myxococcales bacterium]|nr:pyridoxamine 5'-phosphate oxidase family protein [Myxococcales bacterium]
MSPIDAAAPADEAPLRPRAAPPTARTTVKRGAARAAYERDVVRAIADDALLCHVACAVDGAAHQIPIFFARMGDELVLHGSTGNRVLRALRDGAEATIGIALCDGLVLARSAFHHSVNYRSVVAYGRARELAGAEKLAALECLIEKVAPGRWRDTRPPNDEELRRTLVLAVPLGEASAKVRTGGPLEEDEDWELPHWAGVVPL